jgi:23S rRNA pseudouridine2457 synthase
LSFRYLLFHKPYGVLSQFSGGERCLRDYIPVPDVYPVGRLDKDSEGLMLLTNDGPLQHRLSDPKFEHPRTYWAQVDRIPGSDALQALRDGVEITGGYRTRPAKVKLIEEPEALEPRDPPVRFRLNVPTAWIELTLTEGRNRQVRHMTAAVGHPTLRLIRSAIGKLKLAGLTAGHFRDVTAEELRYLRSSMR